MDEQIEPDSRWTTDRPRIRRLLWYRDWLTHQPGFTMRQAVTELEVSDRTVYRDMDYVATLGWDVEYCRKSGCWLLASGNAPLPVAQLEEGEVISLLVAQEALRQYAGTPYYEHLRTAFAKLSDLLAEPVRLDLSSLMLPRLTEPPARVVDPQQFELFVRAARECRRLEVTYHNLERNDRSTRRLDPYHVFAHGPDWYVAGHDSKHGMVRTFALGDRMVEYRETGDTFEPDPEFDLDRYLAEGFGLFRGGELVEVMLRFAPAVARYVGEKVWSGTQESEPLPDGGLRLRFRAPLSAGILRFVLQYGGDVAVEAPADLREQVRAEAARMLGEGR